MEFPVLDKLKNQFKQLASLIDEFVVFYNQKLWHELSSSILHFIFHPNVRGNLMFQFYTEFVKKFSRSIDQINHLKILKESLAKVPSSDAISFLEAFEQKQAYTEETKAIVAGLRANYYALNKDLDKCLEIYHRLQNYLKNQKQVDSFVYSSFYRFALNYYMEKNKQKLFYEHALQYLAYTPQQQIAVSEKIKVLANMGISLLASPDIFNFSELMEQPMLKSLGDSQFRWIYQLLVIFNNGDLQTYDQVIEDAEKKNDKIKQARTMLDQKIRLMAFLELAFNLPKNNRVIGFDKLSEICAIPDTHVEYMVMKCASHGLVKVQINQISKSVTVNWVKPKVLGSSKIQTMLKKFQEWDYGVRDVKDIIERNRQKVAV